MSAGVLSYLRHLLPTSEARLPDGELLRRFVSTGEQVAFTELLRRHGPLVWGVCRRVLGDVHAAEDAFQATFLQLARRAGSLERGGSLAGWLHTVATRTARRARLTEARRRRRELTHVPTTGASADELTWRELRQILDAEIARLPEVYRQPLILCYLEEQPQLEAARRLGIPPVVLRGRLERGRHKLRSRLEKLGLPLAATLLLATTERVPATLSETTCQMVCGALAGAPVPPDVASLATGGTLLSRLKFSVVAAMLLIAGGAGIGGAARRAEPEAAPPAREEPAQVRRVDALDDPLPPGAMRRLGTRRHRIQSWPLPWHNMPDGKSYLAYQRLGNTSEIRRLDAVTGCVLETWPVPDLHHAAGFSPDGRYVLISNSFIYRSGLLLPGQKETWQWQLSLYDLVKRKTVWQNSENLEYKDWKSVDSARFSADGKWIATSPRYGVGVLCLWDATTGKELWNRKRDEQTLEPLGFADRGATVILRDQANTVYLFDRATGKQRRSFPTMPRNESQQCGLAPDGSAILFGRYGPSVRVWDVATGKERPALAGHKKWARCFTFSPDGKTIVTGSNDSFVLVRDWPSGKVVRAIDLGRGNIEDMAISGAPARLEVLFWGEQALHFYDLKTGKERPSARENHKGVVYGVALAPDGMLLSFGRDATIRTWDVKTGKVVGQLPVEQDLNAGGFAVSRDGKLLAVTGSAISVIHVYERATAKLLHKLPAERTVGKHLIFSPDGHWLAGSDRSDGIIQVWDVSTGRTVLKCKHKVVYGIACAFSPDGRQFAASDHGTVRFWDVRTWREQSGLKAFAPLGLAYSPDGRTLATASVEGIRLFELATLGERAHIRADGYPEGVLRFSPTGRWLAWTNSPVAQRKNEARKWPPTGHIFVWDVPRGEMLGSFTGHEDHITDLAFTDDERALVSSSEDSTLLVWDVAGAAARKPPRKPGDVETAWRTLLENDARSADEAIRVLDASPDAAVKLLAQHLKPVAAMDTKGIDAWLRDLDSDDFAARERATRELERLGEQALPALERFLAGKPSLEARRRAELVLGKSSDHTPERLRQMRALEALERIGNDDARRMLEALAKGATGARLTREAQASLERMRR